jgi:superfamily II DNA or RNA helicase
VWDTPRLVDLSRADGDELALPRGCADAVLVALRDVGTKPVLSDERTEGGRIHARFLGRLRAIQGPCADKLAKHDLGVLVAPTGFGKSVIAASVIATHQVSTLVIVPNTALLAQWRESLAKFLQIDDDPPVLLTKTGRRSKHQPGVVGLIGGGKCLRSGIVDVALAGSLFEKGEVAGETVVSPYVAEYGMVIVDEAQHVAASKVLEVLGRVRARYVYGMTATPKRDDGLDRILFLECGPLRHEVAVADQMAEQGMRRLLVPRFCASRPELEGRPTWNMLIDYIGSNEERNHLIATDVARALRKGRVALVLTRRVEHARTIAGAIEQLAEPLGVPVILLVGSDDDSTKRSRLDSLRAASADRPLCVVATGPYVGEGFDLDRLDTLFLAEPVAFEGTATQWVGRLHRVHEGKSNVIVMDYVDTAIPMFDREWRGRMKAYEKLGYQTAGTGDLGLVGLSEDSTPLGHLFAGKEYCKALEKDLADCSSRVVMVSSWMRLARVKVLRELIEGAGKRGVAVGVVLKEPAKPSSEWRQAVSVLRETGCDVRMTKGGASSDCVVLDGGLVWFGSVAPLAFPRRGDCALRLVNREVAASLLETFDMGEG